MKKLIFFYSLVFSLTSFANNDSLKKIDVGLFVEDIYNIDYKKSSYDVVFWTWVNSKDEYYDLENYLDVIKSTNVVYSNHLQTKLKSGLFHSEIKIKATILNQFDLRKFPFDVQNISLNVEYIKYQSDKFLLNWDKKNSRFAPEYIEQWKYKNIQTLQKVNQYKSNFGNTDFKQITKYKSLKTEISLERNQWNIFMKLFLTLFVSFLLASTSVFLPNKLSQEKIGLIVGALFTTIGNKYITDDLLPIQNYLNISDLIHLLTIGFITLFAIFAIYEQRKSVKDDLKFDTKLFLISSLSYIILIILFIQLA